MGSKDGKAMMDWFKSVADEAAQGGGTVLPTPGVKGAWNHCCKDGFELLAADAEKMDIKCLVCGKTTTLTNPRFQGMTTEDVRKL